MADSEFKAEFEDNLGPEIAEKMVGLLENQYLTDYSCLGTDFSVDVIIDPVYFWELNFKCVQEGLK